jgi:cbb3-type cytochrome oxidase maturation protein
MGSSGIPKPGARGFLRRAGCRRNERGKCLIFEESGRDRQSGLPFAGRRDNIIRSNGDSGVSILALLIPVSLCLGFVGLAAFLWSLQAGQYEDIAGDAERILLDPDDAPLPPRTRSVRTSKENPT